MNIGHLAINSVQTGMRFLVSFNCKIDSYGTQLCGKYIISGHLGSLYRASSSSPRNILHSNPEDYIH